MGLADYTSPVNTGLLVIILLFTLLVVGTVMIILNTLINGITEIVHEIRTTVKELDHYRPPKKFPLIIYNNYVPNGIPGLSFDPLLAGFLCRITMSCVNISLNEDPLFPSNSSEITVVESWNQYMYLLQLPKLLILVVIELPWDFNQIQSPYSNLNDIIWNQARVGHSWNHLYNQWKQTIYHKIVSLNCPVIVTGYGSGAPLGALMATMLGLEGWGVCYYGIGSLRIGNNYFYECLSGAVSNHWDLYNLMDFRIHQPEGSDFSYSDHIYTMNVNEPGLSGYLCGLESNTCSPTVKWNQPIYSGNPKI